MLRDLNKTPFYPNELGVIAHVVAASSALYFVFLDFFQMFAGVKTSDKSVSEALNLQNK